MGLDQYVYSRPTRTSGEATEEELWYFRKHHGLNAFMFYDIFPEQCVKVDTNCKVLWFDLERVEQCLEDNWLYDQERLPDSEVSYYDEPLEEIKKMREEYTKMMEKVKVKLKEGNAVYYWAWW